MCSRSLLLLIALAFPPTAHADLLDQSFTGPGDVSTVDANATFSRAQTFTVGRSGTLTRVLLGLGESGALEGDVLTIGIWPTDQSGAPLVSGEVLGAVEVPASALGDAIDPEQLFEIDFTSASIEVVEGEVLAIVASSGLPFGQGRILALGGVVGASYAGGDGWIGTSSGWSLQNGGGFDLLFQTYVEAPEPAGAAAVAAITLAALARKRR